MSGQTVSRVTSKDGASIAYDRRGSGPTVVLVGGGLVDRSENAALALELAEHFTVLNYDRRGRGESGDAKPYALERELEDLEALIVEAGGKAHLYGVSSGGALVLEAAAAGLPVDRLAVYEVPYSTGAGALHRWREYRAELEALLGEGRRGDAVELFMRLAGSPDEVVTGAKESAFWPAVEAVAHTLAYDAACLGDGRAPSARLARITRPILVITGDGPDPHLSGLPSDFFALAADAIERAMPRAERQTLPGQGHMVEATVLAPVLERFFTD